MTSNLTDQELRAQATALRLAGKSIPEIKEITGEGANDRIRQALRGVPPPEWTRRPRAKDEARAKARELRARGYTMLEIADELGVSKGSVSLWTRDMPRVGRISADEIRDRKSARMRRHWAEEAPRREMLRQAISDMAAADIGPLTDREVIIAGAIAYWCEGSKTKAHSTTGVQVSFVNSDPRLIEFFLRFLAVAGVERDRIRCRLLIHESADVAASERSWQDLTGIPPNQFWRSTLKRHNPLTVRKNVGEAYHGALVVSVQHPIELYRQIEGWANAVMKASPGPSEASLSAPSSPERRSYRSAADTMIGSQG